MSTTADPRPSRDYPYNYGPHTVPDRGPMQEDRETAEVLPRPVEEYGPDGRFLRVVPPVPVRPRYAPAQPPAYAPAPVYAPAPIYAPQAGQPAPAYAPAPAHAAAQPPAAYPAAPFAGHPAAAAPPPAPPPAPLPAAPRPPRYTVEFLLQMADGGWIPLAGQADDVLPTEAGLVLVAAGGRPLVLPPPSQAPRAFRLIDAAGEANIGAHPAAPVAVIHPGIRFADPAAGREYVVLFFPPPPPEDDGRDQDG